MPSGGDAGQRPKQPRSTRPAWPERDIPDPTADPRESVISLRRAGKQDRAGIATRSFCWSRRTSHSLTVSLDVVLDCRLKELALLQTLVLDEELFCQHWLSELSDSCVDSCLISILLYNHTQLTICLYDKFKAVPDVVRLGREATSEQYPQLSRLDLHDMKDFTSRYDYSSNSDEDAFDSNYFLHGIPAEKWEEMLRELADGIRPAVSEAFQATDVAVDVKYVREGCFR